MSETKRLLGVLAVGAALGTGADKALTNNFEVNSRPVEMRFLSDGQTAVSFQTKIGDCVSSRELVYSADGGVKLNGRLVDDSSTQELAASIKRARAAADSLNGRIADGMMDARYLSDGQTALTLMRHTEKGNAYAELVVDVDGGMHLGVQSVDEPSLKAATEAIQAVRAEAAKVDTKLLSRPLKKQTVQVTKEPPPTDMRPPGL